MKACATLWKEEGPPQTITSKSLNFEVEETGHEMGTTVV